MRVGLGFDHQTDGSADRIVRVVHGAVVEALIGAAGCERDPDPAPDATASLGEEVREAVRLIERHNYQVVNLDITIIIEEPAEPSHIGGLREELADTTHVGPSHVSVKQAPVLPWSAANEGIAAIAVALLDQIADLDALHASIRSGG